MWVKFYLGANWERASQDSPEEMLQRGKIIYIYIYIILVYMHVYILYIGFWWWGKHNQAHILAEADASHKERKSPLMISVVFYIWAGARNWAHKTFPWQYPPEALLCQLLPGHRGLNPDLCLPWTLFRVCWRPVAAVVSDFILAEPDGESQFIVGKLYYYR